MSSLIARLAPAIAALALTFLQPSAARAQPGGPLRVIRVTPATDASPLAQISVTFDRPVAGSLDRAVDAERILSIVPPIAGKVQWRDPVTILLTPAEALTPGTRYSITVANNFRSMDGSALAEPHRFNFRVKGPTLLGGFPVDSVGERAMHLRPDQRFELVYSAPVDLAKLSSAAHIEFTAVCGGPRIVRLQAVEQRAIQDSDRANVRMAGGWQRDRSVDSLRRVVELRPASPLPRDCEGELVAPAEVEDQFLGLTTRWPFRTYGDFRIAGLTCGFGSFCPTGPLRLFFTNPVRGVDVLRHVRISPAVSFTIRDTLSESTTWTLEGKLDVRSGYAVSVDTAMRDIFGQRLTGNPARGYSTTGYAPSINYPFGKLLVERAGFRTLSVRHVNVDSLVAIIVPIPDSLERKVISRFGWFSDSIWASLVRGAARERLAGGGSVDRAMLTGVQLPAPNAGAAGAPTLYAVRISGRVGGRDTLTAGPISLVQVTDLGVHARIGETEGAVWVTGVSDGIPREGANVTLYDANGRVMASARTDSRGLASLANFSVPPLRAGEVAESDYTGVEGYVKVSLGDDHALAAINRWDPDLSPWRFNVFSAWDAARLPLAATVFTERGIYRPGERVYAKAIVRDGALGSLRTPPAGDSIKWIFHDREQSVLRDTTVRLSSFGTADQTFQIPAGAAVGHYRVQLQAYRQGKWRPVADAHYRVAEYRPPEFLVELRGEARTHMPGDTLSAVVQSRYLFGAPMGRALLNWSARLDPVAPWELRIPGVEDWSIGESGPWWQEPRDFTRYLTIRPDTLDESGERIISLELPTPPGGRPGRVTLEATVTDVNRQAVGARTSVIVHPADFYIAVKPQGANYFWNAGEPQMIDVLVVRPTGEKVEGVRVEAVAVRREWHRVRRERGGLAELVGEWVSDTVARCSLVSGSSAVPCTVTPPGGGIYELTFSAEDANGRRAATGFQRWAAGSDWVPWSDASQFKMDVIPDRARYSVGDTATVLFASPFTNAEAWITVEREGIIDQRQIRLTSGSTTLRFPITEAYAPNAFISIIVARGRSADPGPFDDPGRPTIRIGYAQLRVTPEVKRLTVALRPEQGEYLPADSARVAVSVRDASGAGQRSEVTLWAVDEGVLALTGYTTPDPIDLLYMERGLGLRLASNMTSVAPQVPEGEKGQREPGGGGGSDAADVLRSRFQTTAFFLGSVVTDAQGNAVASARLPDNLTTFRIMAVAVTAGDRYGKGESSLLVTRPLLARPALPRFVRPGDEFTAGAVINRRDGAAAPARVRATASGVTLRGSPERNVTLEASRGTEVRFPFQAVRGDSATFRFDVTGGGDADAVQLKVPIRPDHHPRAHVVAGVLRDTGSVVFTLPPDIDPGRSRLSMSIGGSPLSMVQGIAQSLRIYPYYCTEQLISTAVPLIALYRAQRETGGTFLPGNPQEQISLAVAMLTRRQRVDGGIGYWSSSDWTSAWLSSYVGSILLDAREVGVPVDSLVLMRLANYVSRDLRGAPSTVAGPIARWYERRETRLRDQVAAVDFLSRLGRPDIAAENELIRTAALLAIEDRARLAEVIARRGMTAAARSLMMPTWSLVRVEGRRAVLPDTALTPFYFESRIRPLSRILTATLAIEPAHALVGPLVEALAQRGRSPRESWMWNTQDYASAVSALVVFDQHFRSQSERVVRVRSGNRQLLQRTTAARTSLDSNVALTGLLANVRGARELRLSLDAGTGSSPIYYYLTVSEVPVSPPVTPQNNGIQVERWYETYPGGTPVSGVTEGDLVRVRLRITVPSTREFVVLDDALPAGLEAIDLSLRTASAMPGPGATPTEQRVERADREGRTMLDAPWGYGIWDAGWWSPFDHRELRDDRVVYSATVLWAGTYTATYLARATTPGTFIRPPAHAEEMYNPGVNGRSDGGKFVVAPRGR